MPDVEFDYVEIDNYRQYGGTQRFNLSSVGDRRINIIEGQNGAGKSNFLNAITLCLYGEEQHGSEDSDLESLPYANQQKLAEIDVDQSVDGYIEIGVTAYGSDLMFRREFQTYKSDEETYYDQLGDLELYRLEFGDFVTEQNPNTVLNEIIPNFVKQYFIFDSEDLDAFFQDEYYEQIQKGVIDVSQIELLDRSIYHLGEIQDDLESDAAELGGRTQELKEQEQEFKEDIEEKESLIEKKQDELTIAKDERERIVDKLQDASDERVRKLRDRRENLYGRVEELKNQLDSARDRAADLIITAGPSILAADAEAEALSLLREVSPGEDVPTGVDRALIERIIDTGTCVCGTDLNEHEDAQAHLAHLQDELTGVSDEYIEGQNELPHILDRAKDRSTRVRDSRERIRELEDEIESVNLEIEDISNELKRFDIPDDIDIATVEQQRSDVESRIEQLQREIGRLENQRDDLKSELDGIEEQLSRELRKDRQKSEVVAQLDFVEDTKAELRTIRERILTDVRAETEECMEEYFNELVWKPDKFTLSLDDDYRVTLTRDDDDENLIGSLSAGERQVLALSFMAAISQISGFPAPTVIDTPLGRISSRPRRRIARNLPSYLEGTQITLLVTDEEYTDDIEAILDSHVENEYELEYEGGITEVTNRE